MTVTSFCMNSQQERAQAYKAGAAVVARRQIQPLSQYFSPGHSLVQPVLANVATVVQPQKVKAQEASTSGFISAHKHNNMTPTNADTPLRRSEVGIFRDGARNVTTAFNDDEEERRQARRRTMLQESIVAETSMVEENETLNKCLEIYNGNKLSKENAWSVSLIDTLSSLLARHHKSLNNFKVAGSSLEASSKVYGLRVDSVHTDVLRMSAGLNAQKFVDRQQNSDDDDDVATGGEGAADPNASAAGVGQEHNKAAATPKAKPKRPRRVVSTITKNKDTLNGRLDTVPLQDPVFGKLNSIVGSINSSNRLMNNILLTTASELRLRTTFRFWDAERMETDCDYTVAPTMRLPENEAESMEWASCDRLMHIRSLDELHLRPLHTGYVISDTPEVIADDSKDARRDSIDSNFDGDFGGGGGGDGGGDRLSMAFDINAECEPVPSLSDQPAIIDVDYNDFEELTSEERTAINNCRGLRKAPVLIEDLRPVDASSKLEYSYRPLDKISQFWAGPSHWKFKRTRPRPSTQCTLQGVNNQRTIRRVHQLTKKRSKQLQFEQEFDEVFVKLDKYKGRKANFQRKWDQRKLKLPTDLQLDGEMFDNFKCAPSAVVQALSEHGEEEEMRAMGGGNGVGDALEIGGESDVFHATEEHFADQDDGGGVGSAGDGGVEGHACGEHSIGGENRMGVSGFDDMAAASTSQLHNADDVDNIGNNTVLEIATSFEGAPAQVTKIIVPFAKRAKVIDMKSLKRCCTQLINKQIKVHTPEEQIPKHPIRCEEHYVPGVASFQEMYTQLPSILTQNMAEALTPSVAFYSVLHLANDYNLRLMPQEDLDDFKIRQLTD